MPRTNVARAPCVVATMGEMRMALRALAKDGLPAVQGITQAGEPFEELLRRHGIALSHAGCRLLYQWAASDGAEDRRLTATRWAVDIHACISRRRADPLHALANGLRLVVRHLRPSAGMEAYLSERAEELAALEIADSRTEPARLKPSLAHARSMDSSHTVRLTFDVTLPATEAFEALRDDGVALFRFGHRMGACPKYRTALLACRDLVAPGVAGVIHTLPDRPGFGGIEPAAYIEHFRFVVDDGRWIDVVLARLDADSDADPSRRVDVDAARWLIALSRLGGWSSATLGRLLAREDLLADHPDEFLTVAMNAIEHVAMRDATAEVQGALTLLRMVSERSEGLPDMMSDHTVRRCRRWVAGLRHGHDLLWLDEHLRQLPSRGSMSSTLEEDWARSACRRLAYDRTLARGALPFLMRTCDPWRFVQVTPLIEGVLSMREEYRLLGRVALGEDDRLMRRAGMFMLGLLSGRIRAAAP